MFSDLANQHWHDFCKKSYQLSMNPAKLGTARLTKKLLVPLSLDDVDDPPDVICRRFGISVDKSVDVSSQLSTTVISFLNFKIMSSTKLLLLLLVFTSLSISSCCKVFSASTLTVSVERLYVVVGVVVSVVGLVLAVAQIPVALSTKLSTSSCFERRLIE